MEAFDYDANLCNIYFSHDVFYSMYKNLFSMRLEIITNNSQQINRVKWPKTIFHINICRIMFFILECNRIYSTCFSMRNVVYVLKWHNHFRKKLPVNESFISEMLTICNVFRITTFHRYTISHAPVTFLAHYCTFKLQSA